MLLKNIFCKYIWNIIFKLNIIDYLKLKPAVCLTYACLSHTSYFFVHANPGDLGQLGGSFKKEHEPLETAPIMCLIASA